jgi:anti-anti-sigma regulatory factor
MTADPGSFQFEIKEGTIIVRGELGPEDEKGFEKALHELLKTEHEALVIDISAVHYVSSGYVRYIAMAMVEARQLGRAITVRATKKAARLLALGGVDKLGEVVAVD